jgi:hypothetical protein
MLSKCSSGLVLVKKANSFCGLPGMEDNCKLEGTIWMQILGI